VGGGECPNFDTITGNKMKRCSMMVSDPHHVTLETKIKRYFPYKKDGIHRKKSSEVFQVQTEDKQFK